MSFLDIDAPPALSEQAVRQTLFDDMLFSEMRLTAPALDNMVDDLNRDYGYTDVLVSDVFAQLYQSAPWVRERHEMVEACLLNHTVRLRAEDVPDELRRMGSDGSFFDMDLDEPDVAAAVTSSLSLIEQVGDVSHLPDEVREDLRRAVSALQHVEAALETATD